MKRRHRRVVADLLTHVPDPAAVRSLFAGIAARSHPRAAARRRQNRRVRRAARRGREAGGETQRSATLRPEQHQRYQRHLSLPEVGEVGQRRLLDARVLCVGAGGLGSPCALYLAAAGVGTLGIADPDDVEASNLQRQVLHSTERIGVSKVASAELTRRALNPGGDVGGELYRHELDTIVKGIHQWRGHR